MIAPDQAYPSVIGEKDLRRQVDRSIARALFDPEYATALLGDPTIVLEDRGCPPQQYLSLKSIQASTLMDLARQARSLFWAVEPDQADILEEELVPVAAAAD